MKILLLGKNGQVGFELDRSLQPLGQVYALDRHSNADGLCGDVANFDAMTHAFDQIRPDIVVNATAYTAVDKAETDTVQAELINHLAVKHLAELAKQHQALLIHYSTDYVFDGTGETAWTEEDSTGPINVYGQTKRQGELALEQSGANFINLRTSWVYGTHGNNFIKTMLKLGASRETLGIIADQIGSPTGASLIADITAQIIRQYQLNSASIEIGHYHLAPQGECSWYDYAKFIFDVAREMGADLMVKQVNAIGTADYPTPAKRPHNSRLNTSKLQRNFSLHLPHWQQGVRQVLGELIHDN
ncbi:dTDP-4-dehydrorhamnose reductase [Moraxella pluranimalium]|uniref:dTDP-4-dehydrorhamnose reductase n=1 Tax=Moraxella pluranimalium TaxID=470453 RepID=A0A1T0CDZ3_9GAMM|nr:dTDP-4-dehydrorhamnose reductase [Moraxella pluranimalium]OOS20568.1 dTDP-4-dehydrorhamnose reductase [Moraxella pluranimalium]